MSSSNVPCKLDVWNWKCHKELLTHHANLMSPLSPLGRLVQTSVANFITLKSQSEDELPQAEEDHVSSSHLHAMPHFLHTLASNIWSSKWYNAYAN